MNDNTSGGIGFAHLVMVGFSVFYLNKYSEKKDDTAVSNNTKNAVLGIGITIICLAFISLICLGFGKNLLQSIAIVLCCINVLLTILGMVFTGSLSPRPPPPNPNPKLKPK